jgi:CHAT domain-containing protein
MKYAAAVLLALSLVACTPAQNENARAQAHQTSEQARRDAKEALHKAEVETQKASQVLDSDLHKAREKTRKALGEPPDDKPRP